MTRSRRGIALLGALTALACALPASAAAAEWTHEGEPLEETAELGFSGPAKFTTAIGSYECTIHVLVDLEPGSTGQVTAFEATTGTCEGTGSLAGCTLAEDGTSGLPWGVQVTATTFDISGVSLRNVYGLGCAVAETVLTAESVVATPDEAGAIGAVALSGAGKVNGVLSATISGQLEADAPGTYGIG